MKCGPKPKGHHMGGWFNNGKPQRAGFLTANVGAVLVASMLCLTLNGGTVAQAGPGDNLADRFARDGERADAEWRKRQEQEMLERARSERAKTINPDITKSSPPGSSASSPMMIESSGSDPARPQPPAADASAPSSTADAIRERAVDDEVARRIMEAERQAELDQISERIRRAEAKPESVTKAEAGKASAEAKFDGQTQDSQTAQQARTRETPTLRDHTTHDRSLQKLDTVATRPVTPPTTLQVPEIQRSKLSGRATVLLVMQPGNRGIRRINKRADPILCMGQTCYISQGADKAALAMPRRRAFGTVNTLGLRAGACRQQLECVFRDIDIGTRSEWLQPIDLRVLRHDRRQPVRAKIDTTCNVTANALHCSKTVHGPTYDMWIVPEEVADKAGANPLAEAAQNHLSVRDERAAGATP